MKNIYITKSSEGFILRVEQEIAGDEICMTASIENQLVGSTGEMICIAIQEINLPKFSEIDGVCNCTSASYYCPLGKAGSARRCTKHDMFANGITVY
jgi:hypothetical protein